MYIAETAPSALRGMLVSLNNVMCVVGQVRTDACARTRARWHREDGVQLLQSSGAAVQVVASLVCCGISEARIGSVKGSYAGWRQTLPLATHARQQELAAYLCARVP
jgi:hypothetical protein